MGLKKAVGLSALSALAALAVGSCTAAPSATRTTTKTTTTTSGRSAPTTAPRTTGSPPTTGAGSPPHVMVVVMENKNLAQVIGSADAPYTDSLATSYGLATRSYAFGHPSLPNYLDLVSGSNQGVSDDNPPSSHRFPGVATLADQLVTAGFSAKAYAENLPSDPTSSAGEYAVRHVPWEYFPDARITVADASSLLHDLDSTGAPDFVWYTPNLIDDEHDGSVAQGDAFLARLVPEVQSTSWYRAGGEIIVEWDESDSDNTGIDGGGGGHIATIVVSAALKAHPRQDPTPVDTAGILRSVEDVYGLGHLGAARDAASGSIDALLGVVPAAPRS